MYPLWEHVLSVLLRSQDDVWGSQSPPSSGPRMMSGAASFHPQPAFVLAGAVLQRSLGEEGPSRLLQLLFVVCCLPVRAESTRTRACGLKRCILAWRVLWAEEPDRLQSMGSQRVRHD